MRCDASRKKRDFQTEKYSSGDVCERKYCIPPKSFSNNFIIYYGEVLKWSKRRDSKSRRALTRRVGSNPTFSAKIKEVLPQGNASFVLP